MEIVVGTYDEVLIGFRVVKIGKILQLETDFTDNSHTGCVKCIAISPKGVLASGSTDETIRLLNIKKKKEVGSLVHHSGTVTSLEFQKSFLFSTSEDKTLCIWKSLGWECLKTLKGHKYGVNSVSVHPSGKMALTVGSDRKLMTWNLITGRSAYITNIKEVADIVKWNPEGSTYVIVVNNKIDVYSVQTAEIKNTFNSENRINCLDFYNNDVCVFGGEGGKVGFYNINTNTVTHTCDTSTSRIKGLCLTTSPLDCNNKVMCVGTSEGKIQIYDVKQEEDSITTEILCDHNASFRITCMAVYHNDTVKKEEPQDGAEQVVETVDVDEDDNKDSVKGAKKRALDIDDDDLNMVSRSLYDLEEEMERKDVVKVKKAKKGDKKKSVTIGQTVTVVQENDKKLKRMELLNGRRKERRKDAQKQRKVLMKTQFREEREQRKLQIKKEKRKKKMKSKSE